jgi:hypothetical protein
MNFKKPHKANVMYSKEEASQLWSLKSGSSAARTANQGSKCLWEAQSGLNGAGHCKMKVSYKLIKKSTNQSQRELTQIFSTAMILVLGILCILKNN